MNKEEIEIWKTIQDYPEYMVSNLGRIKSLRYGKERIMKQGKDKDGYCLVNLYKEKKIKTHRVHKLVAQAFIPNPNNLPCINHKDEVKTNNFVSNLEFCDVAYNNSYGTKPERIGKTKSKPILQFNREGTKILGEYNSTRQVERELGINQGNICGCCKGKYKTIGGYKWMYLEDYLLLNKKAS